MVDFIPNGITLSYGIPCQPTATLYTGFLILLTLKKCHELYQGKPFRWRINNRDWLLYIKTPPHLMS